MISYAYQRIERVMNGSIRFWLLWIVLLATTPVSYAAEIGMLWGPVTDCQVCAGMQTKVGNDPKVFTISLSNIGSAPVSISLFKNSLDWKILLRHKQKPAGSSFLAEDSRHYNASYLQQEMTLVPGKSYQTTIDMRSSFWDLVPADPETWKPLGNKPHLKELPPGAYQIAVEFQGVVAKAGGKAVQARTPFREFAP